MNILPDSYISKRGLQETSDNLYYVNFGGFCMFKAYWRTWLLFISLIFFVFWLFLILFCWYSYITLPPGARKTQSYVNYHPSAGFVQK